MNKNQKIIVFDIDGTLADISHRAGFVKTKPRNWGAFNSKMYLDGVHEDIVTILRTFWYADDKIVLCSGRGEEKHDTTIKWLDKNDIPFNALYMRPRNDYRKDSIIKVELLQRIRVEHGEPFLWFDDRNQVVDAIRAEGVRVLQVAQGDF